MILDHPAIRLAWEFDVFHQSNGGKGGESVRPFTFPLRHKLYPHSCSHGMNQLSSLSSRRRRLRSLGPDDCGSVDCRSDREGISGKADGGDLATFASISNGVRILQVLRETSNVCSLAAVCFFIIIIILVINITHFMYLTIVAFDRRRSRGPLLLLLLLILLLLPSAWSVQIIILAHLVSEVDTNGLHTAYIDSVVKFIILVYAAAHTLRGFSSSLISLGWCSVNRLSVSLATSGKFLAIAIPIHLSVANSLIYPSDDWLRLI